MSPALASARRERPFRVDLHGAFIRGTDLSGTRLVGANLAGIDASGATFRGADFKDANLRGAILKGADLGDAKNLTVAQLIHAVLDETTVLPDYIDREALAGPNL